MPREEQRGKLGFTLFCGFPFRLEHVGTIGRGFKHDDGSWCLGNGLTKADECFLRVRPEPNLGSVDAMNGGGSANALVACRSDVHGRASLHPFKVVLAGVLGAVEFLERVGVPIPLGHL